MVDKTLRLQGGPDSVKTSINKQRRIELYNIGHWAHIY